MSKLNIDLSVNVELEILDGLDDELGEMNEQWVDEYVRRNYNETTHAPAEDEYYRPMYEAIYR